MFCPVLKAANVARGNPGDFVVDCREGECAWWDSEWKACAFLVAAKALVFVKGSLALMVEKGE